MMGDNRAHIELAQRRGCSSVSWLSVRSGALLIRVRLPVAASDFLSVNFRCRLSYGVRTAPV